MYPQTLSFQLLPWTHITPFPSEGPALGTSLRSHSSGSSSQPDLDFASWQPDQSQPSPGRTGSGSPCESPAPGSQLGHPGRILRTRLWFPTAAPSQRLRLLHSTPDEPSMRKKREGTGPGLCLQTSNTSSRWGLVLLTGPWQSQRRASAVRFMVPIIRAARLPPARPGDGLRRQPGRGTSVGDEAALPLHVGRFVDVRGPQVTAHRLDVGLLYHGSVQHWVGQSHEHFAPWEIYSLYLGGRGIRVQSWSPT